MKKQDENPEEQLNEVEIGNLPKKEFRVMTVKRIQDLRKIWRHRQRRYKKCLTGGGVKMVEKEDMEFTSPQKYIKNTSTNGTILTDHLLNTSRRPWKPKRTRKIPTQPGSVGQDLHPWWGAEEQMRSQHLGKASLTSRDTSWDRQLAHNTSKLNPTIH